jgi:hypothetical protein
LNGLEQGLPWHLLVSLLLSSADNSLSPLLYTVDYTFKAIDKVAPFFLSDGATDFIAT